MKAIQKIILLFILVHHRGTGIAQLPFSARSEGLAGINVILPDSRSVSENPAQNVSIENPCFATSIKNIYSISGLTTYGFSFILPFQKRNALAFHYSKSGYKDYYNQDFRLSYGIKISEKLNIGGLIERLDENATNEFQTHNSTWSSSLGFSSTPLRGFTLGASITNPTNSKWNNNQKTDLPVGLNLGCSVNFSSKVICYAQVNKISYQKILYIIGFEYSPYKQIQLRTGINNTSLSPSFGASLLWKKTKIDFSISNQAYLGISPGICIQYKFGSNE